MSREEKIELYRLGGERFKERIDACKAELEKLPKKDRAKSSYNKAILVMEDAIEDRKAKVKDEPHLIEALNQGLGIDNIWNEQEKSR